MKVVLKAATPEAEAWLARIHRDKDECLKGCETSCITGLSDSEMLVTDDRVTVALLMLAQEAGVGADVAVYRPYEN
jgi:hypothetical protein